MGYGGSNGRCAEHHRAAAELSSALTWPGMDGDDVATETELTAELRRAYTCGDGLPSAVNGHGKKQWVAGGGLVVLLR